MHDVARQPAGQAETRGSWWSRAFAREAPLPPRRRVSFADLVRLHRDRQHAIEANGDAARRRAAEAEYEAARGEFEREEGKIVAEYWCTGVASAAALTDRPRWRLLQGLGWPRRMQFHRASDWSTHDEPRVAYLLHECDQLAVKVSEVLRGTPHRICMGLAMRSAGNLLSVVDAPSGHLDGAKRTEATKLEEKTLGRAQEYYRKAAVRQAQLVYVGGMLLGIVALAALALGVLYLISVLTNVEWGLPAKRPTSGVTVSLSELFGCATAGALGAVISVVSRISTNTFSLDFEVGRSVLVGIGMFRPLLGAVFGLALYAALTSGLLQLFLVPKDPTKAFYFFVSVAFVAGFSERWARGVLGGIEARGGAHPPPTSAPPA
jgi:hypothetical protein